MLSNKVSKQDFKSILQDHPINVPKVGDIVTGKVLSVDKGEVRIDVEGVTTGIVRGRELFAESREHANLKTGDEVEATVMEMENENGDMELSFRVAGYQRAWDNLRKWAKDCLTIKAKVTGANKGGLIMQVEAMPGFMPVSQLDPEHYPRVTGGDKSRILEKLQELIGKDLEVKVIDADEKEEKLIVSERAVWEDAQKAVLESYKIGDIVNGEVSALTSFGAFLKFGEGLEGLVHISEIAWQRIEHPRDLLKVGDHVKAQIIQLDKSKIYLSLKRLVSDPWKQVGEKYKINDKVKGKIIKIEPFGLMVALDEDIHGLAHVSELSDQPMGNITEKFKIGQEVEFEIMNIEAIEHRLGLRLAGVAGKAPKAPKVKKSEKAKAKEDEKNGDNVSADGEEKEEKKADKKAE